MPISLGQRVTKGLALVCSAGLAGGYVWCRSAVDDGAPSTAATPATGTSFTGSGGLKYEYRNAYPGANETSRSPLLPGSKSLTPMPPAAARPASRPLLLPGSKSNNHDRDGANVLFGGGEVQFTPHPFTTRPTTRPSD